MRQVLVAVLCVLLYLHNFTAAQLEGEENEFAEFEAFDDEFDFLEEKKLTKNEVVNDVVTDTLTASATKESLLPVYEGYESDSEDPELVGNNVIDDDVIDDGEDEDDATVEIEAVKRVVEPDSGARVLSITNIKRPRSRKYIPESIIGVIFIAYITNYLLGKKKNIDLVSAWFEANSSLLYDNFALVGDDSQSTEEQIQKISVIADNFYTLWCSGRSCCEGMLVELQLLRRQDMFAHAGQRMIFETYDEIHIKLPLSKDDVDNYVFCIASKRVVNDIFKDCIDLNTYCPDKKGVEKYGISSEYVLMNEISEVAAYFFDSKTVALLNEFKNVINYIHISDRYAGYLSEDTPSTDSDHKRMFLFEFALTEGCSIDEMVEKVQPMLPALFYWLDRMNRFRLSKEGKMKSEKNRARVDELHSKVLNAARTEAAQLRKEEKRRQEKEKILMEEDPEKQRRLEEKSLKKEMKKKVPRMKQLKLKTV